MFDRITILAEGHMLAALRFSRKVGELEQTYSGQLDERLELHDYATACIFAAIAGLEAYANELFLMPSMWCPEHSSWLMDKLWEGFERKPLLDKFELALLLKERPRVLAGDCPTLDATSKDVSLLIDLRNALVHFKPEAESKAARHKKLSDKLRNKFKPGTIIEGPLFPNGWVTHGCTDWAVTSTVTFAHNFASQIGTIPRFMHTLEQLTKR